jgi:hypothetical protein
MIEPNGIGSMFSGVFKDLRDHLVAEVDRRFTALRDEIVSMIEARATKPRCMSIEETCKEFGFSRTTWDRWLADPITKLEDVILRPNGPGGRVLVPVETFEKWLRERGRKGQVAGERPRRQDGRGPEVLPTPRGR